MEKPRIGGGFGAKQTAVCDVYPAFVTMKTGRPAKINYTRTEAQIARSPRHEMEVRVRLGANKDGKIRVLDLYTLTQEPMVSMVRQQLVCPATNQFRFIQDHLKHFVFRMMLCTQIIRQQVHIVVMEQRREFLRWNLLLMS